MLGVFEGSGASQDWREAPSDFRCHGSSWRGVVSFLVVGSISELDFESDRAREARAAPSKPEDA